MVVWTNWRSVLLASGAGGKLPGSVNCGPQPHVVTQWPSAAEVFCCEQISAVKSTAHRSAELQILAIRIRARAELELRAPKCWKQASACIRTSSRFGGDGRFDVALRPFEERRPVGPGSVAAAVLSPSEFTIGQSGFHRRKFRRAQIFFAEQPEHWPGSNGSHETAALVNPFSFRSRPFRRAVTDERRSRRAQGDQLMRVHRQVSRSERPTVLQKISGHPMVSARASEVFHQLAENVAMKLGATFAGRADEADGEAPVVSHRHKRGFAVTRQAFDADLFSVHCLVGFEIVERTARAPRPRAQRAPVIRLARLAFVAKTDDAARQARAVVGLNTRRNENCVTPAFGEHLLLPRRAAACDKRSAAKSICASGKIRAATKTAKRSETAEAKFHHHRHGRSRVGRRGQRHLNVHADLRIGRVVSVTNELLCDDWHIAIVCLSRARYFPFHSRNVLWHAAINFPIEILHDFRSPPLPPHFGTRHFVAV